MFLKRVEFESTFFAADHLVICCFCCFGNEYVKFEENLVVCLLKIHKV